MLAGVGWLGVASVGCLETSAICGGFEVSLLYREVWHKWSLSTLGFTLRRTLIDGFVNAWVYPRSCAITQRARSRPSVLLLLIR